MRLILIEGLPGSGKSTMAEQLCEFTTENGIQASWYLEEAKDHPVHPLDIKRYKYKRDFPQRCLAQWQDFISTNRNKEHLYILEGSLFQSSVRFMLEGNNQDLISDYYQACQEILSTLSVKLIYLRPSDVSAHINGVMRQRGVEWISKVTSYLEKTPFCSDLGWHGANCMKSFWGEYVLLCDLLVDECDIACQTIEGTYESDQLQNVII